MLWCSREGTELEESYTSLRSTAFILGSIRVQCCLMVEIETEVDSKSTLRSWNRLVVRLMAN